MKTRSVKKANPIFILYPLSLILLGSLYPFLAHAQTATATFDLSWTDASNNEEGFKIYRDGKEVGQVGANIVKYADTVTGSWKQSICYQVSAFNHALADGSGVLQESAKSNQACGVIPVPTQPAPAAPSNLQAGTITTSSIELRWQDNSDKETHFELSRQQSSPPRTESFLLSANTENFVDRRLKKNTQYTYKLRAENDEGASVWSNQLKVSTRK